MQRPENQDVIGEPFSRHNDLSKLYDQINNVKRWSFPKQHG